MLKLHNYQHAPPRQAHRQRLPHGQVNSRTDSKMGQISLVIACVYSQNSSQLERQLASTELMFQKYFRYSCVFSSFVAYFYFSSQGHCIFFLVHGELVWHEFFSRGQYAKSSLKN